MAHRERLESVNARAQVLLREWVESARLLASVERSTSAHSTSSVASAPAGGTFTYLIQVSNTGPVASGVNTVITDWTELVVPGLYLIQDSSVLGWDAPEEYRCLLKSHPVRESSIAYYRCWQTSPSEFARALYFVLHPDLPASS